MINYRQGIIIACSKNLPYLIGNNKLAQLSDDQNVPTSYLTPGPSTVVGINLSIAFLPFDNWPSQAGQNTHDTSSRLKSFWCDVFFLRCGWYIPGSYGTTTVNCYRITGLLNEPLLDRFETGKTF